MCWNTKAAWRMSWVQRGCCDWVWSLGLNMGGSDRCLGQTDIESARGQKEQAGLHCVTGVWKAESDGKNSSRLGVGALWTLLGFHGPDPASIRIPTKALLMTQEPHFSSAPAPSSCTGLPSAPSSSPFLGQPLTSGDGGCIRRSQKLIWLCQKD